MTSQPLVPFVEHWHAQVFAISQLLVEKGLITGHDWSNMLGAVRAEQIANQIEDSNDAYYGAVLTAVERLLATGQIPTDILDGRVEDWRKAYLSTPHGSPVILPR